MAERARRVATGWTLAIHVQPGARRSEVAGLHRERLGLRIAAPAPDGCANEALEAFIAGRLAIARSRVSLARGTHARA